LIAMEPPDRFEAVRVADEKVKVLRSVVPVSIDDVVLGQYGGAGDGSDSRPGYRDDPSVADDSITPTFAAVRLHVANRRWKGVPFHVIAGKALGSRFTEIRVKFRAAARNMFCEAAGCPESNELIIRVQPDESIRLRVTSKVPGMSMSLKARDLNLYYKDAFAGEIIPDAYESLLLDVMQGDKSLFIRHDELGAAWDVFTPVLHEIERRGVEPDPYPFGSNGPDRAASITAG
jgi:glucose-6-phosphate 1-dehydrogenase